MKIIIAVSAPEKTGKTTTLRELINNTIPQGTIIHPQKGYIATNTIDISIWGQYTTPTSKHIKLGINTSGDTAADINSKALPLAKNGCDIIVTACHPERTDSFNEVISIAKKYEYRLIVTSHFCEYSIKSKRVSIRKQGKGIVPKSVGAVNLSLFAADSLKAFIDAIV